MDFVSMVSDTSVECHIDFFQKKVTSSNILMSLMCKDNQNSRAAMTISIYRTNVIELFDARIVLFPHFLGLVVLFIHICKEFQRYICAISIRLDCKTHYSMSVS